MHDRQPPQPYSSSAEAMKEGVRTNSGCSSPLLTPRPPASSPSPFLSAPGVPTPTPHSARLPRPGQESISPHRWWRGGSRTAWLHLAPAGRTAQLRRGMQQSLAAGVSGGGGGSLVACGPIGSWRCWCEWPFMGPLWGGEAVE